MSEHSHSLDRLRLAKDHGYDNLTAMRDEPLFAPIASDPRFRHIFADLVPG